jgi:hypothetical protein
MFNGLKTTEFWVTAFVVVGTVITSLTSENLIPGKYAGLAVGIAAGAYAISRGLKKMGSGGL